MDGDWEEGSKTDLRVEAAVAGVHLDRASDRPLNLDIVQIRDFPSRHSAGEKGRKDWLALWTSVMTLLQITMLCTVQCNLCMADRPTVEPESRKLVQQSEYQQAQLMIQP